MGAVLKVHHLAVISAGFFNTLANAPTQVLEPWDDARDPVMYFKVRDFVRAGEAVERQLPIARLESINSVHEQQFFALAAVRAGIGGPSMLRDLTLLQFGQSARVPKQRQESLREMLNSLAALPKTRVRLPGGVQHLLADPLPSLLQQTDELNSALVQLNFVGYVPQGIDLTHPNARVLPLDRQDVLAHGKPMPLLVQRDRVEGLAEPSVALAFSQLKHTQRQDNAVYADLASADVMPRTQMAMRGGSAYLLTNPPEAIAHTLERRYPPAPARMVTLPARVIN